jgi:hypothetical protein
MGLRRYNRMLSEACKECAGHEQSNWAQGLRKTYFKVRKVSATKYHLSQFGLVTCAPLAIFSKSHLYL